MFISDSIQVKRIHGEEDRGYIHKSIYNDLGKGIFTSEARERYKTIIEGVAARGATGVILGCTEIPMLIKQSDSSIPVFDTTLIHATAAVNFALS